MKIQIYNDGKQKQMSFEATADGLNLIGYGANESDALKDLKLQVTAMLSLMGQIDFNDIEYIDHKGQVLRSQAV